MSIDLVPAHVWQAIVEDKVKLDCEFLALSFFISNLKRRARTENLNIRGEFKAFFAKNGRLPSAQRDLAKIAKLGGLRV